MFNSKQKTMKLDASQTMRVTALVKKGHRVFEIFGKDGIEEMQSYTDAAFATEAEANAYIKEVLEPSDKEAGVYEPDYFIVKEMTECFI